MRQKYAMVQLPVGPVEDQLALAVDTCGVLSLGLDAGKPVAAADVEDLAAVLAMVWPAGSSCWRPSLAGRPGRSTTAEGAVEADQGADSLLQWWEVDVVYVVCMCAPSAVRADLSIQ
jgi:hypothetical protein